MSNIQKIIKYFAIALAVFLIVSIISSIVTICISLTNIFNDDVNTNLESAEITDSIYNLDIDINSANITIKQGDKLTIETNDKYINYKQNDEKLIIEEEKNWFSNQDEQDLIITLPADYQFDKVTINSGAGQIQIDTLTTKKLEFELGAGKVSVANLTVLSKTEIDGGAGEFIINNGNINNLDLDIGVGKVTINSKITGTSEIDAGIGNLELNLIGNDYKVKIEKGIGSIRIDGNEAKNDSYYGTGSSLINISGGIGDIKINFNK